MNAEQIRELQELTFGQVAADLSEYLPKTLNIMKITPLVCRDLDTLQQSGKIKWNASMKCKPYMRHPDHGIHPIEFVAYYGDKVASFKCVGYLIGGYCSARKAIEITFVEKAIGSDPDLDYKFLPIVYELLYAYALLLIEMQSYEIEYIVAMNPISDKVKKLYMEGGFDYISDYDGKGTDAMVRLLLKQD